MNNSLIKLPILTNQIKLEKLLLTEDGTLIHNGKRAYPLGNISSNAIWRNLRLPLDQLPKWIEDKGLKAPTLFKQEAIKYVIDSSFILTKVEIAIDIQDEPQVEGSLSFVCTIKWRGPLLEFPSSLMYIWEECEKEKTRRCELYETWRRERKAHCLQFAAFQSNEAYIKEHIDKVRLVSEGEFFFLILGNKKVEVNVYDLFTRGDI